MKISKITNPNLNRYFKKNTLGGKYERNIDTSIVSGIAFGVQLFRLPSWQIPDIGITAGLGTLAIKSFIEAMKNKKDLIQIKKRALNIKNKNILV